MTAPRNLTAASIALLALLFTGCAAGGTSSDSSTPSTTSDKPAASSQSKEDACDVMLTSLTDLQSLTTADASDPSAVLSAFKDAQAKVDDAAQSVANAEVQPAAAAAATAMKQYVGFLDEVATDPANADASKVSAHMQSLTESLTDLSTVCTS